MIPQSKTQGDLIRTQATYPTLIQCHHVCYVGLYIQETGLYYDQYLIWYVNKTAHAYICDKNDTVSKWQEENCLQACTVHAVRMYTGVDANSMGILSV